MNPAPLPIDEAERLLTLGSLRLHAGSPDSALRAAARLASQLTGCTVGAIGVVDADRQWFLASVGLPVAGLAREFAFCSHTVLGDAAFVVNDARLDPRFAGSPLLAIDPPIAFYAGVPVAVGGHRIASLCVMDHRPRALDEAQLGALRELATLCSALLEARLRHRELAESARRAKSEFLSRVSHEMRTPLNAVIGFTQLLRLSPEGTGPAQVAQYTGHVLSASERLLALINDLLDLQRVDEGRLALQRKPQALRGLVGATFDLLQPLARQHEVALQNQVDVSAWVTADAQRLRQVLINIVSNAIKYNRAGGSVCIDLLPGDARHCVLSVEDTGSGLTQAQLARLFQPFERLGHESSAIEGSGLGLLIARRLIDEMGGQLTLSSVPAGGTRVTIALPRAAAPPAASQAASQAAGQRASAPADEATRAEAPPAAESVAAPVPASVRMLYVEDNRINAILFEEALRLRGGIELQVAEDGAEALALVAQWAPEILVLDANLPDMSGYDVLARLREMPALAEVPAFMCSADAMAEDVQRATAAGFVGYWTKPIDIARVMGDLDRLQLRP